MEFPPKPPRSRSSLFLMMTTGMLAVLLVLFVAGGIFAFTQQQATWKDEKDTLTKKINFLEEEIVSLKDQLTEDEGLPPGMERLTGTYTWSDTALESMYGSSPWSTLTINPLSDFSPAASLTERKTTGCGNIDGANITFLRKEGGLCQVGYWYEDNAGIRIDTYAKLLQQFGPIDSAAEAMSFLSASLVGLKREANGTIRGHALPTNLGYLIHLTSANTFGCGSHTPTGIIFTMSPDGTFTKVASENPPPPAPDEPILCVD